MRPAAGTASKVCSQCGTEKPPTAFNRHRLRADGRDSRCRQCNGESGRDWYRRRQRATNGLYSTYQGMISRCYCRHHKSFPRYGGRGIAICAAWRSSFETFRTWAEAHGYHPHLQLDRIDGDRGYAPDNCRFVTPSENCRNKPPRAAPRGNTTRRKSMSTRVLADVA